MTDEKYTQDDPMDDEWQQLQSDWQSYQPDIEKIKKRIAWVTWRMIAILALDVLVVLSYIPFLVYFVFLDDVSFAEKIWSYLMTPILFYGVYLDFKLRLPLFKLEGESTKDILAFYLKRVSAGVSLGDIGYKFSLLLLFMFAIWVSASFYFDLGEEKLQRPSFIIFGTAWISFFASIMYWYKNKKKKEFVRLQNLWKNFLD